MRKKAWFSGIGQIAITAVIALGAMGVGYAAWVDTVTIDTTVEVGTWGGSLSNPSSGSDNMTLSVTDNFTLTFTLNGAEGETSYYGSYDVSNWGTVPIKIASITPAGVPTGVSVVFSGVGVGTVIDPGAPKPGIVEVTTGISPPPDGSFTETFLFVTWNN